MLCSRIYNREKKLEKTKAKKNVMEKLSKAKYLKKFMEKQMGLQVRLNLGNKFKWVRWI